jgi:hypothetical protein
MGELGELGTSGDEDEEDMVWRMLYIERCSCYSLMVSPALYIPQCDDHSLSLSRHHAASVKLSITQSGDHTTQTQTQTEMEMADGRWQIGGIGGMTVSRG